jgi:SAM-dependent methyltransferase
MAVAVLLQSRTTIPAWHASSPLELCTDLVSFLCLAWASMRALTAIPRGESRRAWAGIVAGTAVFFVGQISDLLLNANALIDEEWLDDQTGYKLAISLFVFAVVLVCKRYLPNQHATRRWLAVACMAFLASTFIGSIDDLENYLFAANWSPMVKMAIWGTRTTPYFTEVSIESFAEAFELLALISVFASVFLVDLNPAPQAAGIASPHPVSAKSLAIAQYALWKAQNPHSPYSEYYAATVQRKLRRGGRHPALMSGDFAGSALSCFNVKSLQLADDVVAFMLDLGLTADHRVVDYGCGSLRVGRLLIPRLAAGHYTGLDVTNRFYRAGLAAIDGQMLADKRPRVRTISSAAIAEMEMAPPDFLLCFAVVQHVPQSELDDMFRNILRLIGPNTTALVSFKSNLVARRFRRASWSYSAESLIESLHRAGLRSPVKVVPPSVVFGINAQPSIWFLQIDPDRARH